MPLHATFANPSRHSPATCDRRLAAAIDHCQISQPHHSCVKHQQFFVGPFFSSHRDPFLTEAHRRGKRTCWLIGIANLCHPPTLVCFLTQLLPIATSRQRTSRVYHTFDTNYDPESPSLLPTLPAIWLPLGTWQRPPSSSVGIFTWKRSQRRWLPCYNCIGWFMVRNSPLTSFTDIADHNLASEPHGLKGPSLMFEICSWPWARPNLPHFRCLLWKVSAWMTTQCSSSTKFIRSFFILCSWLMSPFSLKYLDQVRSYPPFQTWLLSCVVLPTCTMCNVLQNLRDISLKLQTWLTRGKWHALGNAHPDPMSDQADPVSPSKPYPKKRHFPRMFDFSFLRTCHVPLGFTVQSAFSPCRGLWAIWSWDPWEPIMSSAPGVVLMGMVLLEILSCILPYSLWLRTPAPWVPRWVLCPQPDRIFESGLSRSPSRGPRPGQSRRHQQPATRKSRTDRGRAPTGVSR